MAWLSRVNFTAADVLSYTDMNNVGNDIRSWGGNVNGGGYSLSNVVFGSISSISGGTGASSSLTMQSTSGTGTSDYIVFKTASQVERLRITTGGNVGIGTSSPTRQMQIVGAGQTTAALTDSGNTGGSLLATDSGNLAGNGGALIFGASANNGHTAQCAIKSLLTDGTANGLADLAFSTRASSGATALTEQMRITSGGNVGVGTASPVAKLDVNGNLLLSGQSTGNQYLIIGYGRSGSGFSYIDLVGDTTYSSFGTRLIRGSGGANTTTSLQHHGTGEFQIFAYESAPLVVYLSSGEKMRITSSGNVGIGTPTPSYQLHLSADSAAKPSTNTWTIASDARLKTVKGEYQKGLSEICKIRPVRYEYNGLGGFAADGKEQVSILAQELMQVFPECVDTFKGRLSGDSEEIDLYNYNGHAITFALINAIKELKAEIEKLKARN